MGKCTCGKSLTAPWCDGSHTLTEEKYQEKIKKLAEEDELLYNKPAGALFKDSPIESEGGEID
jgi:CDGSH-type Zn-finger protein